jgi:hypothetical protein
MGELIDLRVDGSDMLCYLARPEVDASLGILVCMRGNVDVHRCSSGWHTLPVYFFSLGF